MGLGDTYNYLFVESSLPYTREWPLISSPLPLILIIFGYLYFILYVGPCYMKNRPPFELKTFRLIYDMIQILVNLWSVKEHISAGWFVEFNFVFFTCGERHAMPINANKIFNLVWWLLILKIFDLVETCIFVLRKKQNQVSGLHVYHHISNLTFGWYYLKYILDERATFISLINCAVHVIMYTYYFITTWSLKAQQMVYPIKPYITNIQMVQFIVIIIILLQLFSPNCEVGVTTIRAAPFFIGNLLIFLYLFYDFYKKNYTKSSKRKNN
ncbi:elongation of very long chain fatty acids protein AAEL008004 [Monomorium pharaonis]|uniref:elongation of very long chain fatty acids protein AAEL008004 n=1 Tax=Monomorium pharaonis TaxID=307658 RepID=UPI001746E4B8|nr:elongation of very long chain fatty acids protein AAEL008004 [Monomorium pharaonis]